MDSQPGPRGPAVLVTGGSGFVGRALIRELLTGDPVINASEIRIFDLHPPKDFPQDARIRYRPGDVRDAAALAEACRGIDAVFHMAAMIDWGTHPPSTVYDINTRGTANALAAAGAAGVKAFVYTSSLDAVITGMPLRDVDEDLPYPETPPNAYCGSKAEAERLVAAADGAGEMRTVILRPSGVWGEGDPYHISAMMRMIRKGAYGRIGDGSAVQQLVYAGNLAHAHLQAGRNLLEGPVTPSAPSCAGGVYFITDAPAENFFRFFDGILEGCGCEPKPKNLWMPRWFMMALGSLAEAAAWLIRPFVTVNPKISRFAVRYTCNDFTYTSARARRDFGFRPKYAPGEAREATFRWFRNYGPADIPDIPDSPAAAET